MRFVNLVGATGIIEQGGKRLLLDPWLDDGIYHGSWFHFPPAPIGPSDLGHLDYVFISHIHEDHCSAGTIREINRDAEVIIADREPNWVLRFLEREGFDFARVHLVPPYTPTEIAPGLACDIITADPGHELNYLIDSALVLEWDGWTVYNANDCPPYEDGLAYLLDRHSPVDLALLPYATGSSYPACYLNLTDEEKRDEGDRLRRGALQGFVDTVRRLEPRYAAPFADQYVVGGSRAYLNRYIPHPPGFTEVELALADAGLADVGLLLNPGQSIDLATGEIEPPGDLVRPTDEDREKYIAEVLSDAIYDHERVTFDRSVPIGRLVELARERLWAMQKRQDWFPRFDLVLDVPDRGQRFVLPLDAPSVETRAIDDALSLPHMRVIAASTLLTMMIIGHISWNIADAALFLDFDRRPNVYDPRLHANLNHLRV